jgi:mono/diheme cytochrome c family protein
MLFSGCSWCRPLAPFVPLVCLLFAPLVAAAAAPADAAASAVKGLELFDNQVGALLEQHCLKCHGGDKTQGEFDLTTRDGLLKGGSDGAAVVPGDAQGSLLYKLITHADEPNMPDEADKLPDAAIAAIAAWIDAGAPYSKTLGEASGLPIGKRLITDADRQFWSFRPLSKTEPPVCKQPGWCRTPVDRFILAQLEAKGITPNGDAERRQLIRRAYFDLVGLPPKPEEVDAFLADASPDALDRVIDRLLASPHYGERWGRHWLDLARFAESHGYEQDYDRPAAFHYRDFVIRALNEDMPYDRFVRLQIAGDEFEPDNPAALMATGFLGAGTHATQITANQVEKERYDELDDMASTVGTAMLGLTVGCARCHDHKFDPIPQVDYYRLISTFTTTVRSEMELDLDPEQNRKARESFDREHAPLADALAKCEREQVAPRFEAWLAAGAKLPEPQWLVLEAQAIASAGGAKFTLQEDGSYLASGTNAQFDTYTFVAPTNLPQITAVRLEALADPSMVKGGPGRAANGNFALSDFRLTVTPTGGQPQPVKIAAAKATFDQQGLPVTAAIDDDKASCWAVDPQFGKDHAGVFELETPVGDERGLTLNFTLKFENNTGHNIGRLRLAVTTAARPVPLDGQRGPHKLLVEAQRALATAAEKRSDADRQALLAWFRTTDPDWIANNQAAQQHLAQVPQPKRTKVMVTSEGVPAIRFHTQGADFSDKTYYLKRGDLNQKVSEAPAGFLQVLSTAADGPAHWQSAPPPGGRTSYRRRGLANWITDSEQGAGHLLARVIVNRLWQHHIGRGIVATPSDFGVQGDRPTHPELLDWLAGELVRNEWRLKPIHKLIMQSAAYRESPAFDEARAAIDPDNKLCWRHARSRLEAEVLRDALLAASGTLDETMFGPGTLDESSRRRSIYFTIKRSQLIPLMVLFDSPEPLQGIGARSATTIAPQALALMNNARIRDCARAVSDRLSAGGEQALEQQIRGGYRLVLLREPDSQELRDSQSFIQAQVDSYRATGRADAQKAALADFCQALLNLNEFVFVE